VTTREQEVRERAHREEIRARVERTAVEALGGHERRGANYFGCDSHRTERAEVEQPGAPGVRSTHVAGGDVPVDEPARVHQRQRRDHVAQHETPLASASARGLARPRPERDPSYSTERRGRRRSRTRGRSPDERARGASGTHGETGALRSASAESRFIASVAPRTESKTSWTVALPPDPRSPRNR
jgi:hypothetical protein